MLRPLWGEQPWTEHATVLVDETRSPQLGHEYLRKPLHKPLAVDLRRAYDVRLVWDKPLAKLSKAVAPNRTVGPIIAVRIGNVVEVVALQLKRFYG